MENIIELSSYCLNCKTKPCQKGCPLGNDIPAFVQCVKNENFEKAFEILSNTTLLPSLCGRICPHSKQCQGNCVRGIKGEPVSIGKLESIVGDYALKHNLSYTRKEPVNKSVAVVGSGPAGLTCAGFLAQNGFDVTIYEQKPYLGGLLVHGIPDFRLDKSLVNDCINKILDLGILVKYNQTFGKDFQLQDLTTNYDFVVLAVGANVPYSMDIPGNNLPEVLGANTLLEFKNYPDFTDKTVSIIGGGNVAMDISRTVNKLGASKVNVIYRRSEKEMPAELEEISAAKDEGVSFLFQTDVIKVIGTDHVSGLKCIKTDLVSKAEQNRLVPIPIEGSEFDLNTDFVIMAIGSKADNEITSSLGLETNKKGYIVVNENFETSIPNVYAIGDFANANATVAWAAKTGRDVANVIYRTTADFLLMSNY